MENTAYFLISIGVFVDAMSVVGLLRFPDIFTRLHAATKTSTFGAILIVSGVMVESFLHNDGATMTIVIHSGLALLVIIFTNPVSAHAIARASLIAGIKPYGTEINEYKDKQRREVSR
ncbi:MAG: cation:proton antiporter [bacterium]|nr:cation:proton antiporter [bacterium]